MLTRLTVASSLSIALVASACAAPPPPPPPKPPCVAARPAPTPAHRESPPPLRLAPRPPPAPDFVDADRQAKLAALLPKLEKRIDEIHAREKAPSLAVALIVGDDVVLRRVLGVRDVASGAPATARTLYRIGSITKTFTTAAILALRDNGLLRLDDPVDRWVPELARVQYPHADAPRITIRHLLTHTSGLPRVGDVDYVSRPDVDVPESEVFAALDKARLESAPGTRYSYSNLALGVAGILVGRVWAKAPAARDRSFRGAMNELVLRPLGMTSTTFDPRTLEGAEIASGYEKKTDTTPAKPWRLGALEGAGGLWSSLDDMGRWVAFQLAAWPPRPGPDDGPLRRASVREAHVASFPIGLSASLESGLTASADGVGLGWHTSSTCAYEHLVKHGGAIDGFNASVVMAPERGFGLVVLSSSLDTPTGAVNKELLEEIDASGALGPRVPRPAPELEELVRRLARLQCDEAEFEALFTPEFRAGLPFSSYQPVCKQLAARHGDCTVAPMTSLDDPMGGKVRLTCERGEIDASVRAVDTAGGVRLQSVLVRSTGFGPPKRLVDAAKTALELEARWDSARFAKGGFAASVVASKLELGLAEVRKQRGTCRFASPPEKTREGNGITEASFELRCERGGRVVLETSHDDAGALAGVRFVAKETAGRCEAPAPR